MAAPNLIGASTALGKSSGTVLTTTNTTTILNNPASSGKCLKINTFNVANYGASTTTVTVSLYTQANAGGIQLHIVGNASVPAGSTFCVIDRSGQYYLEENTSVGAIAANANVLTVTCSYEEIS